MTEYWQSQARKYCEFCKCWLADNKVSISFHENGKKHKESVQKHISVLSKKSAKDFKAKEKMDDEMKKMERAAMAAYMKDVENNADITSQSINALLGNNSGSSSLKPDVNVERPLPVWKEVKCNTGSYFWNTQTSETRWDAPDEYFSLAQQEEQALKEKEKKKALEKQNREKFKKQAEEARACEAREKMKHLRPKSPQALPAPSYELGPAPRADPYGGWTSVCNEPTEKVDLQLPKTKEKLPPPVIAEPEVIRFKERKVESLGDGPVEFKKRKFNNPKRNMRQKLDDD